jgi:preprotein translocase subunit SecF
MIEEQKEHRQRINYNKIYKYLIIIPAILLIFCIIYMINFYNVNNDFFNKDISLKGGTSITVYTQADIKSLEDYLSKEFSDFSIREISDLRTGKQEAIIVEVSDSPEKIQTSLEKYFNISLNEENSSVEFTGSSMGESFYKQALFSILLSFAFMGMVVFLIFAKGWKIKFLVIIIAVLPLILFIANIPIEKLFFIEGLTLPLGLIIYFRKNMPSFFVILCAFMDILMTITAVNLLGIKVSTAGIMAFLMLIGYSVDSDILLTTRVLKSDEGTINSRIKSAFKTGMIMTLTSITAVAISLLITQTFSLILKQIFTILLIGLFFDIFNTWITNASLIKYYAEKNKK